MEERDALSNDNLDLDPTICKKTKKTAQVLWYLGLAGVMTLVLCAILGLAVPMLIDKELLMGLSVVFGCLIWVGMNWFAHFKLKNIWTNPKT